jgi:hypothetical protein
MKSVWSIACAGKRFDQRVNHGNTDIKIALIVYLTGLQITPGPEMLDSAHEKDGHMVVAKIKGRGLYS